MKSAFSVYGDVYSVRHACFKEFPELRNFRNFVMSSSDKSNQPVMPEASSKFDDMEPAVFKKKVESQLSRFRNLDERSFEQIVDFLVQRLGIPKSLIGPAAVLTKDFLARRKKS